MSQYGQQQQGYPGQYNNAGYDNSGTYPPQQQQDPNYGNGSAPPYSAYPVAGGMGQPNNSSPGGGYPGSPGFNPSAVNGSNYNNNNLNHSNSHNSQYNNGPMNGGYDANNNNGNANYGQQYQSGALNYQQSIYNPSSHHQQQQNQNQSQSQNYNQSQQQPGMSPGTNNGPAPVPNRAQAPQPEGDYPVVMAIDFGTTFSGVAYALKADGEVHDMTKWPRHLAQYPKTPTLSLYKKDSQKILDWGHAARLAMLKPSAKDFCLLRKFKLQLDESIHQAPLENGISALDAVTHYLKKLHGHVLSELMKGFIKNYEPSQFQYCLTVPAMWSDAAKNTMRRAAIGAGLIQEGDPPNRLILISEPEAAAMYCERMVDRFSLKHGDRFMICDAGGGTVDLIVFEVSEPPGQARHLKEVTRGHGASCGSVFLDANMERLLERKFKRYRRGIKACGWASLMDTFVDMVKPMFNGQEDVLMQIPQATGLEDLNDSEIGLEDGVLCVSVEEMKAEVFEPVISDVLDLIHKQLHQSQNCSAIFLVGGFGSSRYLEERVRQDFSHLVGLVAVPQRPELAVVRGAVYAGLNTKTINMRVARRWYGVDANMPFEEGVDPESKKIISHDGHIRCKERFSVYVRPGQQIGVDECVSKEYVTWSYPKGLDSPLYVCNSPNQPKYITDPGVQKIADFHIPMPEIPGAQPRTRVVFKLNMYFGLTEVRAEAVINGNTYTTICSFGSRSS
ncbi:hypothetical protein BGZ52_012872 [Haplosporangium bisporale]|uniref:Uncharacterized protein n=1 Tax=Podila verticillata NRRL 6337 TaxID=1069443 RepID=A0A086TKK6_9FUNG|nr:hypothetical protein BGZ52_012872 [Haplosporangium bisporale]KAI9236427.1 MAG: hypothetical protein BYD32DRAFT_418766 [Podila humilis]KFH62483.1 hypothetical protein MVEG_11692 [Podila verticillata NRRL 6337]